jgi:ABC-type transport system substrate-binding protein
LFSILRSRTVLDVRHILRQALVAVAISTAGVAITVPGAAASGPGNVDLKKAVNYAIDREAMLLQRGAYAGVVNDQNLPPDFPGFTDAALYPSRPDIARAQALAGWRPGDPMRPAVLYTCNSGACIPTAQIVQANLAAIGLAVDIQVFPRAIQFVKAGTRGEPFDLTLEGWHIDYYDPHDFMFLLDGATIRPANNSNFSYYDDPDYNNRFADALAQTGQARIDALGALDVHVASTTAPRATYMTDYDRQFFSDRIGCHTYHGPTGSMSLAALCLRPGGMPADHRFRWDLDTDIDYVDPALAYYLPSWQIEQATCARLVNFPDAEGDAGRRLVPEIAQALPTVSPDGLTYTFTLRDDFMFSSGVPVAPAHFKYALERLLTPRMASPGQTFFAGIVGAADMIAGRAPTLSGVTVDGNTLRITLVRPAGDFLARLAMPFACPLPLDVPINPDGISAPVPSAGPYYIAAWTPRNQIRLERNPNYHGTRPAFFDGFDVSIGLPLESIRLRVESGQSDYGPVPPSAHAELAANYGPGSPAAGVGRQRWFANQSAAIRYLALNHDRPLFGSPPPLAAPPPPPPAPPPPPRPRPRAVVSVRSGSVVVSTRRVAAIRLRCGGAPCRGRLTLFARLGTRVLTARKPIKLGTARFTIPRGKTRTVRVRLSRRAFNAVKLAKRLKAQAVITLLQPGRKATVKRSTIVLRAPRRR